MLAVESWIIYFQHRFQVEKMRADKAQAAWLVCQGQRDFYGTGIIGGIVFNDEAAEFSVFGIQRKAI